MARPAFGWSATLASIPWTFKPPGRPSEHYKDKVEHIEEGKEREEQPKEWRPDINEGVKINIAPGERLSKFPVKKIVLTVEMGE